MAQKEDPGASLAEKVDQLFRSVRSPRGGEYSYNEVATALQDGGGPTISSTYVWQLRRGIRDNPTKKHIEALARFFHVAPSYFFDEADARRIEAELGMLTALRDPAVRALAARAARLSPDAIAMLVSVAEQIARLEGGAANRRRGRRATDGADDDGADDDGADDDGADDRDGDDNGAEDDGGT